MTDVVVFLDALSPRELTGVLDDWYQGDLNAGVPRVTPRVMASIYTGLNPAENGMMGISKYEHDNVTRPQTSTFIEQAMRDDADVLSMNMPFCVPFRERNDNSHLHGTGMGEPMVLPETSSDIALPRPSADMVVDDPDTVFSSFLDQTRAFFFSAKEAIRRYGPDIAFIGYRQIDVYCHFQHTEARNGKRYRQHLIDHVSGLLDELAAQIDGDLMFFSDHGQTELTDVFHINQWLAREGYLSYTVDYDYIDATETYQDQPSDPLSNDVENQLTFNDDGVTLHEGESLVVCDDPFDSMLTLLCDPADFPTEQFREDLLATGLFNSVKYKWEVYDEDAPFYDSVPDIIPDRADGVFVSGNIHKNPIGMGYYRTGVHDHTGCYGGTSPLTVPSTAETGEDGMPVVTPEEMYEIITDFADIDVTKSPIHEHGHRLTSTERKLAQDELEVLS